jgi:hypothetical protein
MSSKKSSTKATIAADAFACSRRPVWRELLKGGSQNLFLGNLPLTIHGDYKPVRAKHSRFVPVQDSLAIVADSEFSRHAVLSLRQFAQFSQSRNGFRSCWGLDIKDQPIGTFGEVEVVPEPGSLLLLLSAAGVALLPLVFRPGRAA